MNLLLQTVTDKSSLKNLSHDQDDSQFQRLKRSVVRLTRRYHRQERVQRNVVRIMEPGETVNGQHRNGVRNGNGVNHIRNGHDAVHGVNGYDRVVNGVNGNGHYNFPRKESKRKSLLNIPKLQSSKRLEKLEKQVTDQQQEIQSLKDCVSHLRGSLQLSDAQNLALQVMLKKMSKAESKLPRVEKSEFRNQMKKSEQQLENLVSELKEMSQMKYPTITSNNHSGSVLSFNGNSYKNTDLGCEDELLSVHDSISGVRRELNTTQKRLHRISQQIDPITDYKSDSSMNEAYEALLKTEKEIENLR